MTGELAVPAAANLPILIVDDDEDVRFLLCALLRRSGFDAKATDSAESCLELLSRTPVAVVVTDVQMSGMSGIELCSVLRARYPAVVPIVMSGLASSATADAALEVGAFIFLRKPVSAHALETALHLALSP